MKTALSITCLSLCAIAFAEESIEPKPQIAVCKEAPEIVRPIGRVGPVENAASKTEAIPKDYAEEKANAIVLEGLEPIGERLAMRATLRIINPTDKPMKFTGFSETNPITKVQHWKDGKWVDEQKILRCGTGLRPCVIAPGQSAVFVEAVYPQTMPTRFGVSYTHGDKQGELVVWSEKIER